MAIVSLLSFLILRIITLTWIRLDDLIHTLHYCPIDTTSCIPTHHIMMMRYCYQRILNAAYMDALNLFYFHSICIVKVTMKNAGFIVTFSNIDIWVTFWWQHKIAKCDRNYIRRLRLDGISFHIFLCPICFRSLHVS